MLTLCVYLSLSFPCLSLSLSHTHDRLHAPTHTHTHTHTHTPHPQGACESCLPLLVEKLGDSNTRLREASKESIMFIAGLKDAGLRSSTQHFVKPIKNQNQWRLVLGVLALLQVCGCVCVYVCVCLGDLCVRERGCMVSGAGGVGAATGLRACGVYCVGRGRPQLPPPSTLLV